MNTPCIVSITSQKLTLQAFLARYTYGSFTEICRSIPSRQTWCCKHMVLDGSVFYIFPKSIIIGFAGYISIMPILSTSIVSWPLGLSLYDTILTMLLTLWPIIDPLHKVFTALNLSVYSCPYESQTFTYVHCILPT